VENLELSFLPIRPDAPEEKLTALSEMARFTFSDTFRHYTPKDLEDYLEEKLSPQALIQDLNKPRNTFYFVVVNGQRAGFIKWTSPSTLYLEHSNIECGKAFLLERFYFLPKYCGRGLASVALEFVTSYATYEARADYLYLSVWEKNFRAQNFYQKHGFRTLGSFDYPVGSEIDREFLYGKRLK
jgi:diamine N-acetyltransferase